jgi:mono/diheme cytochrome c family protein/cytochrome c551/c552
MWRTNLKVLLVAAVVLAFYTTVAHIIPQLQSEVPENLTLGPNATPEALVAAGEKIFNGAGGCTACHGLGTRAPNLLTDHGGEGAIGVRCGNREPGKDCKAYIYESLTNPTAYVVKGFEPIMPDMRRQLTEEQIWTVVAFLQSQGGEVTVTGQDLASATRAAPAAGGAAPGGGGLSATTDPLAIIKEQGCFSCHKLGSDGMPIAPPFDHIGSRVAKDYIRESILDPNAKAAKGYEKLKGMMPTYFGSRLSATQLEILVNFLASQK